MRMRKVAFLFSMLLLLCAFAAAQTEPVATDSDKAKKKKEMDDLVLLLLDQSTTDANGLRLPGNRALVDAMAADIYWKIDEKHARELFKSSAVEIVNYNAEAEKERAESTQLDFNMYDQNDPRNDVLQMIARHDADMALEVMLQTRSPRISDAMAKMAASGGVVDPTNVTSSMDNARAMQETSLEQSFVQRAAGSDPDKLAKLIKDSIAKGISTGVISMLQSLNQKDEKKAADLGSDVIAKLMDADMVKNVNDQRTGLSFLQYAARPMPTPPAAPAGLTGVTAVKGFAFSDAQMKSLAGKIADALLVPSKSISSMSSIASAIPTLEKFVPERISMLKARDAENKKSMPTELQSTMNLSNAFSANSTPEDMLAQLAKTSDENMKRAYYPMLLQKISTIPDEPRAKKLIDQIPDDKQRATAQEQFDAAKVTRAAAAGKIDDARILIRAMTNRKMQVQRLVALATQVQRTKAPKDIELAKEILSDARALTKDFPDNEDDLADIMEIIRGEAVVDPDAAFHLFEPLVDEFNGMIQAAAVLSKYNKQDKSFKRGEFVLHANGNFGTSVLLFRYVSQIQLLGKADLEHMGQLADRFQRPDSRAIVKLITLQGYMAPDPKPMPPMLAPSGLGTGAGSGAGTSSTPVVIRP